MNTPRLLSPLQIGPLTLRNRIVMPAMELNFSMDGSVTETHLGFYGERAAGGAGMIIVGGCTIDGPAGPRNMLSLKTDDDIPGMARIASGIRDHGAIAAAQLYHAGAYSHAMLSGEQAISASVHVSKFTREECREMSLDDIATTTQHFVQAAQRAEAAGFQLIEICASAGYLIDQFMSAYINKRDDEYGGDLGQRMRFGVEVVQAVRAGLKPETALSVRIAGNDFVPGSGTNVEAQAFAQAIAGHCDMINVTGGWHETRVPQLPADLPRGGFVYLASGVKGVVQIPVAASNRLGDPALAEAVLRRGQADMICMGRPLIADPFLPNKLSDDNSPPIVPCTACNQSCFDNILKMQPVGCMVNPRVGKESEICVIPSHQEQKVLVIGGGVAGCSAAITAAERGHKVTLAEAQAELGGQVRWSAEPTHKPEFPTFLAYQAQALRRAGVEILLNTLVDENFVKNFSPDQIVVATGAESITPPIPGVDDPKVVQAWDLMQHKSFAGQRVVVIGGGAVGSELAVWLAAEGALSDAQLGFLLFYDAETPEELRRLQRQGLRDVTLVEMKKRIADELGSRRWIVVDALHKRGVKVHKGTQVKGIEAAGVRVVKPDGSEQLIPCDTVALAVGSKPKQKGLALVQALRDLDFSVALIGDAAGVARIPEAVAAGFDVGRKL